MTIHDNNEFGYIIHASNGDVERLEDMLIKKCQPLLNKFCKQHSSDIYDLGLGGVITRVHDWNRHSYNKYYELSKHLTMLEEIAAKSVQELLKDPR